MKILTEKKKLKVICVLLIFITIFISIIPNYSIADADEDAGGKLFNPIFKMFAGVGDLVIKGLQKIFVGYGDIRVENPRKVEK